MKQLNIAILEDNQFILKDLTDTINELKLANIKVKARNTTGFLEKLNEASTIDALVLDIDIDGDSMNGIDVANHLKLPTLFISGKTKNYLNEIEDLRLFHDQPVEFLTKPIREDKLKLVFEKFEKMIAIQNGESTPKNNLDILVVKTKGASKHSIKIETIAYLDTKTKDGNRIILDSGDIIETPRGNFNEFLNELPSYFLKINRREIINTKKIDRFLSTDEVGIPIRNKLESFIINSDYKEKLLDFRPEFK